MLGRLGRLARLLVERRVQERRLKAEVRALAAISGQREQQALALIGLLSIEAALVRRAVRDGSLPGDLGAEDHLEAVEAELLNLAKGTGKAWAPRLVDLRWRGAGILSQRAVVESRDDAGPQT